MRNKKVLLFLSVTVLIFWGYMLYQAQTFTFEKLDKGDLIDSYKSPNQEYEAIIYAIPWGGAVGGVYVKVQIASLKNPEEIKIIYYAYGYSQMFVQWLDNETIKIVNKSSSKDFDLSMVLNFREEIFDEHGAACKSTSMKNQFTECYTKADSPNF